MDRSVTAQINAAAYAWAAYLSPHCDKLSRFVFAPKRLCCLPANGLRHRTDLCFERVERAIKRYEALAFCISFTAQRERVRAGQVFRR